MSSLPPVASIASQPPVASTPPVRNDCAEAKTSAKDDVEAAEKAAGKVAELTATAVKAQAIKESGKGLKLDIRV